MAVRRVERLAEPSEVLLAHRAASQDILAVCLSAAHHLIRLGQFRWWPDRAGKQRVGALRACAED
eukprot:15836347-Heterocapsa_arctica.AAC.1